MKISMNERDFINLLTSIDAPATPPEGLKESVLKSAIREGTSSEPVLSGFERLIFEKPFRAAGLASAAVSGALWAILGSGFPALVSGWIG